MDAVIRDDLLRILDSMTPRLLSPAYGVFGSSFKYAQKHVLINKNPASSAISIKRKQVSQKEAKERAYNRRSYKDDFTSLKKLYGLPEDFHWHDLRHVYAALMVHYQVNIKELAVVLGHSSGIFTMQHYVVPSQKVCEEVPEFEKIFLNAMPVKLEDDEIVLKETLIFEVPEFDEYSENLIKSSTIRTRKIDFGKEPIAETREIPYNNAV